MFDFGQGGGGLGGRLITPAWVLLQAFLNHRDQRIRHQGVRFPGVPGFLVFLFQGDGQRRFAFEGDVPGHHFVEDDAEGVDVDPGVDLLEVDLFGGHVFRRSEHQAGTGQPLAFGDPGQPEIHDFRLALAVDHHVLGLEVAMDDAEAVRFTQALGDLPADIQRFGRREMVGTADEGLEVFAFDVFHRQVMGKAGFAQVVHPADAGMGDPAGELEFVPKTLDGFFVEADFRLQELEGDVFLDLAVIGPVNAAHAAPADLLDDFVTPGKQGPALKMIDRGDHRPGEAARIGSRVLGEGRGAAGAEPAVRLVFRQTRGAFHGGIHQLSRDFRDVNAVQSGLRFNIRKTTLRRCLGQDAVASGTQPAFMVKIAFQETRG